MEAVRSSIRDGLTHQDIKVGGSAIAACIASATLLIAIMLIAAVDLAVIGGITVGAVGTVLIYETHKRFRN